MKTRISILIISLLAPIGAHAQNTSFWKLNSNILTPVISNWTIDISSTTGTSTIYGNLYVKKNLQVDGKVGVGTTTPSQTLAVQGNALFSGNISSVSSITATGTISLTSSAGNITGTNSLTLTSAAASVTLSQNSFPRITFAGAGAAGASGSVYSFAPSSSFNAPSGTYRVISVTPTYNQSSASTANTDLYINRTETAVGSGAQYLVQAQVGSADRFTVSNTGAGYLASNMSVGTTSMSSTLNIASSSMAVGNTLVSLYAGTNSSARNFMTVSGQDGQIFTLRGDGFLGIGTSTPWGQLSVNSNGIAGPSFVVGSSTRTSFVVTNGGNVGVGTAAPSQRLHVKAGTSAQAFLVEAASGGYANVDVLSDRTSGNTGGFRAFRGTDANAFFELNPQADRSGVNFNTGDGSTGASTKMTLTQAGNLGIGTTTPTGRLQVSATNFADTALFERAGQTTDFPFAALRVLTTKTSDMANNFGTLVNFNIQDDAGVINSIGDLGAVRAGADNTGDLVFRPSVAGSATERMRIMSGGNVGIGTTSPQTTLDVNGIASSTQLYVGGNNATRLQASNLFLGSSANVITGSGSSLLYGASNTTNHVFQGTGNVGVGTTSPFAKLSVAGGAYVGGNLTATGTVSLASTGSAPIVGNVTLVAGTATVTTSAATASSYVLLTRKTSGGTIGTAITYTVTGGSFTVTSDNILDTSTFTWLLIN